MSISSRFAGACLAAVLTCCFSAFLSLTANAQPGGKLYNRGVEPKSPGPGCILQAAPIGVGGRYWAAWSGQGGGSFITDSQGYSWWCPPEPDKLYNRGVEPKPTFQTFIAIETGFGSGNANFNVSPPFSVNDTGGVFGVSGGILYNIPGTNFAAGGRLGWLGGNMSGSTFYPTSGFDYSVQTRSIVTLEAEATWRLLRIGSSKETTLTDKIKLAGETAYLPYVKFSGIDLHVSLGAASVKTNVNCSCGTSDSSTTTGFTGAVGIGAPIANTPISLIAQYRYINVPSSNVYIPGMVPISGNINIFTVGMQWAFVTAQTPR